MSTLIRYDLKALNGRVYYELDEVGEPNFEGALQAFIEKMGEEVIGLILVFLKNKNAV